MCCRDSALEIKRRLSQVPGFTELTVVRELGQPSLLIDVDRDKIARYGINVSDVEAVVQAAVGGQAATQVIQGEKLFDLVVRMKPEFRENAQQIGNLLVGTPSGQQIASELARRIFTRPAAHPSSIAKTIRATSACSSASKGATCRARSKPDRSAIGDLEKSLPAGLPARLGRRVQRVSRGTSTSWTSSARSRCC